MSANDGQVSLEEHLEWLGFEEGKTIYTEIEHNLTLDDLFTSLRTNKREPNKRRNVELKVLQWPW